MGTNRDDRRALAGRQVAVVLVLLAASTLLRGYAWGTFVPAWQGPDEIAHYSYVERVASQHDLPPFRTGAHPPAASLAIQASLAHTGASSLFSAQPVRPYGPAASATFPPEPAGLPTITYGDLGSNRYPPAYYLLVAPFYDLPGLATATDRLYAIRFASALLGIGVVLATYLLMRTSRVDPVLSLVGAAIVSLVPMFAQAQALVNPDILLMLAVPLLARSCLIVTGDARRRRDWLLLAFLFCLTAATKPVGLPAAAVVASAVILTRTAGRYSRRMVLLVSVVGIVVLALIATFAVVLLNVRLLGGHSPLTAVRFSASYLWQYYLPRLSWMTPITTGGYGHASAAWSVWVVGLFGHFGILAVTMPPRTYQLAIVALLGASVVAVVGVVRGRSLGTPAARAAVPLATATIAFVLLLHASEAVALLNGQGLLLQGRYLLPAVPLAVAAIFSGLAGLPRRSAIGVAVGWCATMVIVSSVAMYSMVSFATR